MSGNSHRLWRRLLLAGVALTTAGLIAGGIAYATVPGALYGDINACFKSTTGSVRLIDPYAPASDTCRSSEAPISWSRGYAQEWERGDVFGPAGADYTAIVGSSLLGGRNWPFSYVITAKTVVHTDTPAVSECKLEAWRDDDIPRRIIDESRQGPTDFATHSMQGGFTAPINVQLLCRAVASGWKAERSTIIGTQVGAFSHGVATDADPHSP